MIQRTVTSPVRYVGGAVAGAHYPLRAGFFILRHPSLWPYCIIPIIINVAILVGVWQLTGTYSEQWLQQNLAGEKWWEAVLHKLAQWMALLLRVIATLIAFVVVGNMASVPFNDFLSERTDRLVTGWKEPPGLTLSRRVLGLLVTIGQEAKRLGMYGAMAVSLFLLSFIPPLAPFAAAAQLYLSSMFFAMDYFSYPLERRGLLLLKEKKAFARQHLGTSLGFGGVMTLIALIPIVNFLFFPLGVVGGTLLFADISGERRRHASGAAPADAIPPPPPVATAADGQGD